MVQVFKGKKNELSYCLKTHSSISGFDIKVHLGEDPRKSRAIGEYSLVRREDLVLQASQPNSAVRELAPGVNMVWSGWLFLPKEHRGQGVCSFMLDKGISELEKLGGLHMAKFTEQESKGGVKSFLDRGYKSINEEDDPRYVTLYRVY